MHIFVIINVIKIMIIYHLLDPLIMIILYIKGNPYVQIILLYRNLCVLKINNLSIMNK